MILSPEQAPHSLAGLIARRLAAQDRVLVALDGMAASGKTTLAAQIAGTVGGCAVVHMDDFFLPQDKRDAGYAAREIANSDIDRVLEEVLLPLSRGEAAVYRPYVHHPTPAFLPPVRVPADARAVIVEGAYSLHPKLFDLYDLRVLATVSPQTQRARILARNGEAMLERFVGEWIPLENRHIAARALSERCDAIVRVP